MNLLTKHFDINDYKCILDLITPHGVYYAEYNNKHKCIDLVKWL